MKICFVITGLSTGGAETMLYKLLQRLDRAEFDPFVISLTNAGGFGPLIRAMDIPVETLDLSPSVPSPRSVLRLTSHIRRFRPDVVHTWMYHADLIGGVASRLAGVRRLIWSLRQANVSAGANKSRTMIVIRLCSLLSRTLPDRILSCSTRALDAHAAIGYDRSRSVVIPNGFDLSRFQREPEVRRRVREELGIGQDDPLVGLFGRFDVQKNHLGFICAARHVRAAIPRARFVLAGAGVTMENPTLRAWVEDAGLSTAMLLLGLRDDMPRLMTAVDVLASSSLGEAFPNVVGEAMACEVPCVVTDVGDCADIVGETGRVVALGDMVGLAKHLIEIIEMPTHKYFQLGEAARDRIAQRFDIGQVAKQYEDVYRSIVEEIR